MLDPAERQGARLDATDGRAEEPLLGRVVEGGLARGEVSVREVMEALNKRTKKPRAYTTYMTILGRLHAKGLVTRRREGKTDFYTPTYTRAEYADLRAQAGVDSLVEQYGDAALSHFARQMAQLDPERRRQLQRLARNT